MLAAYAVQAGGVSGYDFQPLASMEMPFGRGLWL